MPLQVLVAQWALLADFLEAWESPRLAAAWRAVLKRHLESDGELEAEALHESAATLTERADAPRESR